DVVRQFERLPSHRRDLLGLPQASFLLTDTLLIFDNVAQTIKVVANAHVGKSGSRKAYEDAIHRIDRMIARLRTGRRPVPKGAARGPRAVRRWAHSGAADRRHATTGPQ